VTTDALAVHHHQIPLPLAELSGYDDIPTDDFDDILSVGTSGVPALIEPAAKSTSNLEGSPVPRAVGSSIAGSLISSLTPPEISQAMASVYHHHVSTSAAAAAVDLTLGNNPRKSKHRLNELHELLGYDSDYDGDPDLGGDGLRDLDKGISISTLPARAAPGSTKKLKTWGKAIGVGQAHAEQDSLYRSTRNFYQGPRKHDMH
jgi:hypothetical protein